MAVIEIWGQLKVRSVKLLKMRNVSYTALPLPMPMESIGMQLGYTTALTHKKARTLSNFNVVIIYFPIWISASLF